MKYNAKYDRWVSKEGLVYLYSKSKDKLVLCKANPSGSGYLTISTRLDNLKLYQTEKSWYYNHNNKCRCEI